MGFFHCHLATTHTAQAKCFAKQQDAENTLAHLTRAAEHAIGFIVFASAEKFAHTSLLFLEYEDNGGFTTGSSQNDAMKLLQKMESADFDFVRDREEFTCITKQLKSYAGNWTPVK